MGVESALYTFNEAASFIFRKIKLGWEKEKIIEKLAVNYRIEKERAIRDVEDFIEDLIQKKLILSSLPQSHNISDT